MKPSFTILPSALVDESKWNNCIDQYANGLIYSTTVCLNALAENWHGLVMGDYEAVMPLPWKKKGGIRYCYTPPFIQQLGVSGNKGIVVLKEAVSAITSFTTYGDFQFNFSNTAIDELLPVLTRTNLVLPFAHSYDVIAAAYKTDVIDNVRKAQNGHFTYVKDFTPDNITLYHDLYAKRTPHVKTGDYNRFALLCNMLHQTGNCITRSVIDPHGEVLSTAVLLKDTKRIYNIMNATTPAGRAKESNYFLFDNIIQEFSGQPLLFDLEGSDLPGVKKFYERFGAVSQPYFHYHMNRLPWLLRLFKR